MKKLLKEYGFNSDMQYFEMIVTSVINGQRTQAKEQFNAMPKADKKAFVKSIFTSWSTGLNESDKSIFIDLI
jgi:hypothetical protein